MKRLIYLLALTVYSLVAAECFRFGLENLDSDVIVAGAVNAATGEYLESVTDMVVAAPDPLIVQRHYSSGKGSLDPEGWMFSPALMLVVGKEGATFRAFAALPSGTILPLNGSSDAHALMTVPDLDGFSHCPDVKENLKQAVLSWENGCYVLTTPQGGRKFYKAGQKSAWEKPLFEKLAQQLKQPSFYFLVYEQLPSGNQLIYHYYRQGQLKEIEERGNQVLGWIRFSYSDPQETVIRASDGQEVHYYLENDRLKQVSSNHKADIVYSYTPDHLLCHKDHVDIEYDESRRVKTIKTSSAEPTAFNYSDPATEIIDPRKNKTIISYDSFHRIKSIEHFAGDVPVKTIKKTWNQKGDLTEEFLQDASGYPIWTKNFLLDERDHFIQEKLSGRLTGKNQDEEYFSSEKTFSDDAFHLLLKSSDDHGTELAYSYRPGTNLLTEKVFLSGGEPKKRWTFEYDENAVLIRMAEEADGECHTTAIVPKTKLPSFGQPQQIEEMAGPALLQKTIYGFNEKGETVSQTVISGNNEERYTLEKKYDSHGNRIFATDPAGNAFEYLYDEKDRLIRERSPEGFLEYSYDAHDHLILVRQDAGNGQFLEETFSFNDLGDRISSTDKRGHTVLFGYDCRGRLIQDERFQYSYDPFDRIISTTDSNGYTTVFTYNARSQPLSIHYPDGSEEIFSYDPAGSLHRKLCRDCTFYIYEYDEMGRTVRVEHFSKADKGPGWFLGETVYRYDSNHLVSSVNEKGYEISYRYDPFGRLCSVAGTGDRWQPEEESPQIEYTYDCWGRISQEKRQTKDGLILLNKKYDRLDRLIEERIADSEGHSLPSAAYSYNAHGDLIATKKGSFWQAVEYDSLHRPIQSMDSENNQTGISYCVSTEGIVKTIEDQRGWKTLQTYDDEERLLSSRQFDDGGNEISLAQFAYDSCGHVISQSIAQPGQPVQRTVWTYGPMGRVEFLREAVGTSDERKTVFSYTNRGKLKTKELPTGEINHYKYGYDIWEEDFPHYYPVVEISAGNAVQKFFFDSFGHVHRAESGDATVTRRYGYLGRILEETITGDLICGSRVISSYDSIGRCTSIRLPDSSKILYRYQGIFPQSVSRISNAGKTLYSHEYASYDTDGRLCQENLIDGCGIRQSEWNANGLKQSIDTPYFHESIDYDLAHRPIASKKKDALGSATSVYSYDALSQLVSENGQTHSFDPMGNPQEGQTNCLNELLSLQNISCTYDRCGHLQSKQIGDRTIRFETAPFGALSQVKAPDWNLSFISDALGRRLSRHCTKNNKLFIRDYFFFDDQEIGALNCEGEIIELKIPSMQNGESIAFELKGDVFLPNYDLQGNVVSLVDPLTKQVVESYRYSAFGEETIFDADGVIQATSHVNNPWRYAGRRVDPRTGLVRFSYRDYDPQLRRWIQPDPVGFADGPNLYQYCRNNPLCYQDRRAFLQAITTRNMTASRSISSMVGEMKTKPEELFFSKRWITGTAFKSAALRL